MQHLFCGGIVCEGMIFFLIICALVTLLALTNRILVVCYVKLLEKHFLMLFFKRFYVWHWNFLFVVFTIYLTRLISLSIILNFIENIATYTIWGIAGLELPMKVVVSCVKLGVGADILWSQDCLMGLPKHFCVWSVEDWEPTELKHLSRWRKRKQ